MQHVPGDRVTMVVLQDDRRLRTIHRELDDGAAVGERVAQLARVDLERERVGFAAVDDARDEPAATQAAGRA